MAKKRAKESLLMQYVRALAADDVNRQALVLAAIALVEVS